jgi:hypothetical protein
MLNEHGVWRLPTPDGADAPPPYVDVDGDGWLKPQDVVIVINYLNNGDGGEAEAGTPLIDDIPLPDSAIPVYAGGKGPEGEGDGTTGSVTLPSSVPPQQDESRVAEPPRQPDAHERPQRLTLAAKRAASVSSTDDLLLTDEFADLISEIAEGR